MRPNANDADASQLTDAEREFIDFLCEMAVKSCCN
jgi:hypothetical protein